MKEFWVYTALRGLLFVATLALVVGVWLLVADEVPVLWAIVVAFVLSGLGSFFVLPALARGVRPQGAGSVPTVRRRRSRRAAPGRTPTSRRARQSRPRRPIWRWMRASSWPVIFAISAHPVLPREVAADDDHEQDQPTHAADRTPGTESSAVAQKPRMLYGSSARSAIAANRCHGLSSPRDPARARAAPCSVVTSTPPSVERPERLDVEAEVGRAVGRRHLGGAVRG